MREGPQAQAVAGMSSGTIPQHESGSGPRRLLAAALALAVALGAAAGVAAWWYHTTRPMYRLRQGQEALRQGRVDKAARVAQRLEANGYADHAHLLRGEALLREHRFTQAVEEFNQIHDRGDL